MIKYRQILQCGVYRKSRFVIARNGEFDEADELIKKGESELTNAHNAQTELLAKEAQGKDIEYSIMLVHAQDHLMTTIMYERVAKEFITLYREKING